MERVAGGLGSVLRFGTSWGQEDFEGIIRNTWVWQRTLRSLDVGTGH